jgi:hypothetical protein
LLCGRRVFVPRLPTMAALFIVAPPARTRGLSERERQKSGPKQLHQSMRDELDVDIAIYITTSIGLVFLMFIFLV